MTGQRNKQNGLKIKFLDFGITRIEFQVNEAFIAKKRKAVKFGTLLDGEAIFDEKNLNLTIRLEARVPRETEAMPFRIEVQGKGIFKLSKEPEDLEKVAWINCAAIIFPFIRETVADVTRRSGLAPLLIPPINFVRLYEARKKNLKERKVPNKIVLKELKISDEPFPKWEIEVDGKVIDCGNQVNKAVEIIQNLALKYPEAEICVKFEKEREYLKGILFGGTAIYNRIKVL